MKARIVGRAGLIGRKLTQGCIPTGNGMKIEQLNLFGGLVMGLAKRKKFGALILLTNLAKHGAGRPHGFRTSFRTWVQDTNAASFDVAETALAHVLGNKTERAYARSDLLDQRRVLMQKWGDHVTGEAAQVVRLRG